MEPAQPPSGAISADRVASFHLLYYDSMDTWMWMNTWFGIPTQKSPLDLWVYQEILWETRPDLIVESGTACGGSALFLATVLDRLGGGSICTIDIADVLGRPEHPRIRYILGSSTADDVVSGSEPWPPAPGGSWSSSTATTTATTSPVSWSATTTS